MEGHKHTTFAKIVDKKKKTVPPTIGSTKYPFDIMISIRKILGGTPFSIEYDHIIDGMTKVDVLDKYIEHSEIKITGLMFREAVFQVFGINLNRISEEGEGAKLFIYPNEIMVGVRKALKIEIQSNETDDKIMSLKKAEVMDLFFDTYNIYIYSDMLRIVNLIYGINLSGISSLEHSRISLFSKSQWIVHNDTDLFVVYTGTGDIDVKVYPTPQYTKLTGLSELPPELHEALLILGFWYQEETGAFYYRNQNGETVPDSFKGQTLSAIKSVIGKKFASQV
ncbi:MAG: hypothetical protein ACQEWV_15705 [Bacillota bacterium]